MPDSGGNTQEKRNMKSGFVSDARAGPSNFDDNYKDEKPYTTDQAKEVEELSKLKQKRFNSTDVNSSDPRYSYRL
jgi:hypothetical protein